MVMVLLCPKITALIRGPVDLMNRVKATSPLKAPSKRNRKVFAQWMENQNPIILQETGYYKRVDDLVSLADNDESQWLDGTIEDLLACCLPKQLMQVQSDFCGTLGGEATHK